MKGLEEFDLMAPEHRFPASAHALRLNEAQTREAAKRIREITGSDIPEDRLFTWQAEISNHRLDSYFTRMAETSLRNYAEDALAGVTFLDSHDHSQRIGYSLDGAYEAGDNARVIADFYCVRGVNLAALPTDQFIEGVMFGLIRDVSIGFKEGEGFKYTCSICGLDMFDWDCMHIPGFQYEVKSGDPQDDPSEQDRTEEVTCFAWIENARLSEVSAVFDGATPSAMILKATRELRGGRLRADAERILKGKYRIELPTSAKQFRVLELPKSEENMAEKDKPSGAPDNRMMDAEARLIAREHGVKVEGEPDALEVIRTMGTELNRLRPFESQATDGRVLRAALVEETLAEGVRAFGDKFNRTAKETMLSSLDVETVREMKDSWKAVGDEVFKGGRRSQETVETGADKGGGGEEDEDDAGTEGGEGSETAETAGTPVPEDAIGGSV